MNQDPPRLNTDRLWLRWLTLDDADLMFAVWTDPEFVRHVGDRGIRTIDDARAALADGPLTSYAENGFGPFHLSLRGGSEAVGICGLFKREYLGDPDLGFALLPSYRRFGYAQEAAVAVINHARTALGLKRLTAIVSPGNASSIRLLEKLGLEFERMLALPDDDEVLVYGIDL